MMNRGYGRGRNRHHNAAVIFIFLAVTAVTAAALGIFALYDHKARNNHVEFYEYYTELIPEKISVVYGDTLLDLINPPLLIDGRVYVPYDFIVDYVDEYLFWEPKSERLTASTGTHVYKFNASSAEYTVNMRPGAALDAPVLNMNGIAYLPESLVRILYDAEIYYVSGQTPNLLVFDNAFGELEVSRQTARIKEPAMLRYSPGPKEPICAVLDVYEPVVIYGDVTVINKKEYVRVRTQGGLLGYIAASQITDIEALPVHEKPLDNYRPTVTNQGRIIMTWHYLDTAAKSASLSERVAEPGLDVLSPTWFSINESRMDGTLVSVGDIGYVRWAHSEGRSVWALVSDNYKKDVSKSMLTITDHRERLVSELIYYAELYELDGINIDFEKVSEEDAAFYIQFLRELYPLLRERGMVLSVDMLAPGSWNLYYNRTEVAKTCDFVIIMGYDEHWSTSDTSGPNASIGFVRNAVDNTLKEVPPEKIILGIPVFVRVWREEMGPFGEIIVSSRSYSMDRAVSIFAAQKSEYTWDDETAHYYAEYTALEDGKEVLYRVWMEDERSLSEKLNVARERGLAGVSSWRKGFEEAGIWELLYNYKFH